MRNHGVEFFHEPDQKQGQVQTLSQLGDGEAGMWVSSSDVIIGLVSGVAATFLWAFVFYPAILKLQRRIRFRHLPGIYSQKPKFEYRYSHYPDVVIERRNGRAFRTSARASEDDFWEGAIIMDDLFGNTGIGQYSHYKKGNDLWGTHEIQILDNRTLLVLTTYADRNQQMIAQGFIWEKKVV